MKTEKRKFEIRNSQFEITQNCSGFTLVEILTVVMIIAILVSILVPALNMVKKMAMDVQEKAQLASISIGLDLYKNDFGDYPTSHGFTLNAGNYEVDYGYCGAQTLAETMFGQDLLGFDPNTKFIANDEVVYEKDDSLNLRKGPYLQRENIPVFRPNEIFSSFRNTDLYPKMFLICDVYTKYKAINEKKSRLGTPILYFKANVSKTEINPGDVENSIYNYSDNAALIEQGTVKNQKARHTIDPISTEPDKFYEYIEDPLIPATATRKARPVRPDTFLLISAGYDGLYGTSDDICNFEPNIE